MKIVLSCVPNPAFEALPEALSDALARLGHEVHLFDHRAFLLPGRLRRRVAVLDRFDRSRLNRAFVRRVRALRPQVVLVNQGMVLDTETIAECRALGARCVNWFSDFPAEFERGLERAPAYDRFYLASSWAAARHREAGHAAAAWMPFGCGRGERDAGSLAAGSPRGTGDGTPDVVFVGSHYPERQVLLRHLRGLPVGVWGPGWERARDDAFVAPMLRGGALRPVIWRRLYARCRVALNIHYGCFGPSEVSGGLANTRVFEILACGAYQVVDRQADVLRLFEDDRHLATFTEGEELRARVVQALRDHERRDRVARGGRALVLERHTYEDRAARLLDPAPARDYAPRTAPPDPVAAATPIRAGAGSVA